MGAPKPLKRAFFISASEGGKACGRCEKSALLRVGIPQYGSSFESLLWECQSPRARIFQQRAEGGKARGRCEKRSPASRNPSILSELRKLLWERESPRARILHKRVGRRQGTRARRKIHGEIAAVPFQETCAAPGADAAFVPRIGRAPFSGRAANAKKPCGSTPLR